MGKQATYMETHSKGRFTQGVEAIKSWGRFNQISALMAPSSASSGHFNKSITGAKTLVCKGLGAEGREIENDERRRR